MKSNQEQLREAKEIIRAMLTTISLDWYASHFCKTTKGVTSSGVVEKIHNIETLNRIKFNLERARLF